MPKNAKVVGYEFRIGPNGIKVISLAETVRGRRYLLRSVFVPSEFVGKIPSKEALMAGMEEALGRT